MLALALNSRWARSISSLLVAAALPLAALLVTKPASAHAIPGNTGAITVLAEGLATTSSPRASPPIR